MMEKLRIHIMNNRHQAQVYQAAEEQVRDAVARNADIADKFAITMGSSEYDYGRWTDEDLRSYYENMKEADVLMGYTFPTENIRGYAPRLKWIHFNSSGVEQITPFDWVPSGLLLTNSRGVHQPKSGESFATYLGMLNSAIPKLFTAQRKGKWERTFTSVIKGRKLVVIGVGCQGGEIARQGKRLGMRVTGINPRRASHPECDEVLTPDRLPEALKDVDILAIAAPLTKETYRVIGEKELRMMPASASLLNVARGQLLDAAALDRALRAGELAGAILDVFDNEPLEDESPLWTTPNLIMTPHVSSDDPINYMPRCLDILMRNIRNRLEGRPLENLVDTGREY